MPGWFYFFVKHIYYGTEQAWNVSFLFLLSCIYFTWNTQALFTAYVSGFGPLANHIAADTVLYIYYIHERKFLTKRVSFPEHIHAFKTEPAQRFVKV